MFARMKRLDHVFRSKSCPQKYEIKIKTKIIVKSPDQIHSKSKKIN